MVFERDKARVLHRFQQRPRLSSHAEIAQPCTSCAREGLRLVQAQPEIGLAEPSTRYSVNSTCAPQSPALLGARRIIGEEARVFVADHGCARAGRAVDHGDVAERVEKALGERACFVLIAAVIARLPQQVCAAGKVTVTPRCSSRRTARSRPQGRDNQPGR